VEVLQSGHQLNELEKDTNVVHECTTFKAAYYGHAKATAMTDRMKMWKVKTARTKAHVIASIQ
jgi:hypothetical protein